MKKIILTKNRPYSWGGGERGAGRTPIGRGWDWGGGYPTEPRMGVGRKGIRGPMGDPVGRNSGNNRKVLASFAKCRNAPKTGVLNVSFEFRQ